MKLHGLKVIDLSWPASDYATFQKAMIAGVSNGRQKIDLLNSITRRYPSSSLSPDVNMEIAGTYLAGEQYQEALPYLKNVLRTPGADALTTAQRVKDEVASQASNFPPGYAIAYPQDNTIFIKKSLKDVLITLAEAVVWSTKIVPRPMPAKAPSGPSVTDRRSSSLPTQAKTMSCPPAAARGVGAARPPLAATHASARAAVRL